MAYVWWGHLDHFTGDEFLLAGLLRHVFEFGEGEKRRRAHVACGRLVEAPGIEPGSEKVRHDKPTCVSDSVVVGDRLENRRRKPSLSPIVVSLLLRAEALGPSLREDARWMECRPPTRGGYLRIKQRMQTADWQLWFSDRFTG